MKIRTFITCLLCISSLSFSESFNQVLGQYLSASFDFRYKKDKSHSWKQKKESLSRVSLLSKEERIDFYIKAFALLNIDGESLEELIQFIVCQGDLESLNQNIRIIMQDNKKYDAFAKKKILLDILSDVKNECFPR